MWPRGQVIFPCTLYSDREILIDIIRMLSFSTDNGI